MKRADRRRRLPADQARRRILETAEKLLTEVGPQGLRLTDVAGELGITHQAILHHFESRERLLEELARAAISNLGDELIEALEAAESPTNDRELLDRVFHVFGERGQARLIAWLALSGMTPPASHELDQVLRRFAQVVHAEHGGDSPFENTLFTVMLAGLAVFGDAIAGPGVRRSAGLDEEPATIRSFREWLTRVLVQQVGALAPPPDR